MTYINLPSAVADDMIDVVGVEGSQCAAFVCSNVAVVRVLRTSVSRSWKIRTLEQHSKCHKLGRQLPISRTQIGW